MRGAIAVRKSFMWLVGVGGGGRGGGDDGGKGGVSGCVSLHFMYGVVESGPLHCMHVQSPKSELFFFQKPAKIESISTPSFPEESFLGLTDWSPSLILYPYP